MSEVVTLLPYQRAGGDSRLIHPSWGRCPSASPEARGCSPPACRWTPLLLDPISVQIRQVVFPRPPVNDTTECRMHMFGRPDTRSDGFGPNVSPFERPGNMAGGHWPGAHAEEPDTGRQRRRARRHNA